MSKPEILELKYERLTSNGFAPTKGSKFAAGFDLYSAYDYIVPKKNKELIRTDIQLQIPTGCYGRIAARSGLALHHFIDVGAGCIDGDYRGNICVLLFNHSDTDFVVKRGMRVAQLILERYAEAKLVEGKLDNTERGQNGFGSSGLSANAI